MQRTVGWTFASLVLLLSACGGRTGMLQEPNGEPPSSDGYSPHDATITTDGLPMRDGTAPPRDGGLPPRDGSPPPPPPPPPPPSDGGHPLSDLVNTDFYGAASSNGVVEYKVQTCNHGAIAAGRFYVDLYYHRTSPPQPGDYGNQVRAYEGLEPGTCVTSLFSWSSSNPGVYVSWIQVDADNIVYESDESNNVAGPIKVDVGGTTPLNKADLVIAKFDHHLLGGNTVRYRVQVCNKGGVNSSATSVHVYYNRQNPPPPGAAGANKALVPSLSVGDCVNRHIFRNNTPPGDYLSWAQVDPMNTVPELDEGNNVAGPLKVFVGGSTTQADLYFQITDVVLQLTSSGGITIHYMLEICNSGQVGASQFRVDIYFNRSTPPGLYQHGDIFQMVSYLGPNACTSQTGNLGTPPPGTYTSWAQVDTDNAVLESNENNNIAGPKTIVVPSTPPPPPPDSCDDICDYLVDDCGMLQPNQHSFCMSTCQNQTSDVISCALAAMQNNQCMEVIFCMF